MASKAFYGTVAQQIVPPNLLLFLMDLSYTRKRVTAFSYPIINDLSYTVFLRELLEEARNSNISEFQITFMSRQLEDLTTRELTNASSLVEKGKYEKALEKLNKAEKLAEKAKSPDLLCRVLLHKGEILDSMDNPYEALLLYEKALETSLRFF